MRNFDILRRAGAFGVIAAAMMSAAPLSAQQRGNRNDDASKYRGRLGKDSAKIKREKGKVYVWAGVTADGETDWYDFSGAPMPPGHLQFGIGKDRIRAIDDPLFVAPDDPRLMQLRPSPYRRHERPKKNDDIMVIGYAAGDDARAYPLALLDGHELVNDRINGKPVTVGW